MPPHATRVGGQPGDDPRCRCERAGSAGCAPPRRRLLRRRTGRRARTPPIGRAAGVLLPDSLAAAALSRAAACRAAACRRDAARRVAAPCRSLRCDQHLGWSGAAARWRIFGDLRDSSGRCGPAERLPVDGQPAVDVAPGAGRAHGHCCGRRPRSPGCGRRPIWGTGGRWSDRARWPAGVGWPARRLGARRRLTAACRTCGGPCCRRLHRPVHRRFPHLRPPSPRDRFPYGSDPAVVPSSGAPTGAGTAADRVPAGRTLGPFCTLRLLCTLRLFGVPWLFLARSRPARVTGNDRPAGRRGVRADAGARAAPRAGAAGGAGRLRRDRRGPTAGPTGGARRPWHGLDQPRRLWAARRRTSAGRPARGVGQRAGSPSADRSVERPQLAGAAAAGVAHGRPGPGRRPGDKRASRRVPLGAAARLRWGGCLPRPAGVRLGGRGRRPFG